MYLKTLALVLRISDYNDRDALLTLLTAEHGRLTAKARGLRRKNSPLTASCQLLALSEFTLYEYKGMYTINEAHSVELFTPLRRDLVKLSLGTYFAQVGEIISQEDAPGGQLQSLVLNCLYALSQMKLAEQLVKAVFELRVACIAGYAPDLRCCSQCGSYEAEYFDLSGGCLLCKNCKNYYVGLRHPVSEACVDAMRYIVSCDSKKLFCFSLAEAHLQQLANVTEAYLITQLERGFSALDFYKSLFV